MKAADCISGCVIAVLGRGSLLPKYAGIDGELVLASAVRIGITLVTVLSC